MSSSNSSDESYLAAVYAALAVQSNRYFSIIVMLFGVIGCCLNIVVFVQRALRTSPCTRFFLTSSIAGMVSLLSGLMGRLVAGWGVDPAGRHTWLCKFRTLVNASSRCAAIWLIVLAAIDRWLCSCSNVGRRQMSSMKNANRSIALIVFLAMLGHIAQTVCYEPFQLAPMPQRCYGSTPACRVFDDLFYAFVTVLIPCCLMLIFGAMTIKNIQYSRRAIIPTGIPMIMMQQRSIPPNQRVKIATKNERNLTKMLFVQVFFVALLTLLNAGQSLYATYTYGTRKSQLQTNRDQFLYNLALLLSYSAIGIPFYVYTLTGSVFRSTLIQLFKEKFQCFS